MGKKGGGGSMSIPEVQPAPPVPPANPPITESAAEVAAAAADEKRKLRNAFGSSKTVIAGGNGLGSGGNTTENTQNTKLGGV